MRKSFSILCVLVLALAAVFANGSSETSANAGTNNGVTLEFWGMTDDQTRYQTIIDQYTALHPEVTINLTCYSSTEIDQALTTALAGRAPMDLFVSNGTQLLEGRVSTGMTEPLNSYISASGFDISNYGSSFANTLRDGECYGLPYRDSVSVLIYNKTYFDQRGVAYPTADTTWDELLDIAEKMTWGEGGSKVWGLYNAARNSDWNVMALQNGEFSYSDDLSLLAASMNWKLDAVKRGVMLDNAGYTAAGVGIRAKFSSGMSSMYFGGDWTISQLNGDMKKGSMTNEWDVAPMPKMADGRGRMKTVGTYVEVSVCSYSKNKQEAFNFLTYMCGEEGAKVMASDGFVPGYKIDVAKELFSKQNEETGCPSNIGLYFEIESVPPSLVKGYSQIETLVKQEADLVFANMETVDKAIDNIKQGRTSILAR